jgi:hypothetical protein
VTRVAYTYKMVAIVLFDYQYAMSFDPNKTEIQARVDARHLQYYHTQFLPTVSAATENLRHKLPVMYQLGEIEFIQCDLYEVSGDGPLDEKTWTLVASYDTPDDVPGVA